MTFETVQKHVAQAQAQSAWQFEGQRDAPLSLDRINDIEREQGVELPDGYRRFLSVWGAGEFAFTAISSPDPSSDWSIWRDLQQFLGGRRDFLPFAGNGCGDYYGFPVASGRCEDRIVWADHEQDYSVAETEYDGFIDYMVREGLRLEP